MTDPEREAIVHHRLQRADKTLVDAKYIAEHKLWNSAANRLYYACYYAVTAFLLHNEYDTYSHPGATLLLGAHFVSNGIISKEQDRLYQQLLRFWQDSETHCMLDLEESDIQPLIQPAESFMELLKDLVGQGGDMEKISE